MGHVKQQSAVLFLCVPLSSHRCAYCGYISLLLAFLFEDNSNQPGHHLLISWVGPPPGSPCSFHKTQCCGNPLASEVEQVFSSPKSSWLVLSKVFSSRENRALWGEGKQRFYRLCRDWAVEAAIFDLHRKPALVFHNRVQDVPTCRWILNALGRKMMFLTRNEVWLQMLQVHVFLWLGACKGWRDMCQLQ